MAESFPLPPRLAAMLADLPLDALAFAPAPVRARKDGWTAARQIAFINRLALTGSPGAAARAVGMSRESAYRLRARPGAAGFAAAWDEALGWGESRAIDLGMERAILGEAVPVMYRGRRIGTRLRYDNCLVIATLNAIGRRRLKAAPTDDPVLSLDQALAALEADHAANGNKAFSRVR
jgi:hypothetical protein